MKISDVFYSLGDMFGGTSKQAKKAWFNSRVSYEINKGQIYINALVPYKIYNTIPQVKIPIDKLASMFSNGVFKYQKIGDDKLQPLPPEIAKLLENPNLLQGQNPFLKQYYKQLKVYGNQFMYKTQPSALSKVPTSLKNISPALIKPELTGKYFDQVSIDGIIKEYIYTENGNKKSFEINSILWSKIDDLDNPLIGASPLLSLEFPTSNTELAYKYLNCISGERGAIGMLSKEIGKDNFGSLPETANDKIAVEKLERELYGVDDGQMRLKLTSVPLRYTPMSYPTRDLMLPEQIDANALTILDAYGVNRNLFNNSTYENLKNGLISTHNDTVQPDADGFTQLLSKFIGVPEGDRLVLDYSHLPYLQADKKEEVATLQTVSSSLKTLVDSGIITPQQAASILQNQFNVSLK